MRQRLKPIKATASQPEFPAQDELFPSPDNDQGKLLTKYPRGNPQNTASEHPKINSNPPPNSNMIFAPEDTKEPTKEPLQEPPSEHAETTPFISAALDTQFIPNNDPRANNESFIDPASNTTFFRIDIQSFPVWFSRLQAAPFKLPASKFDNLHKRWIPIADHILQKYGPKETLVAVLNYQLQKHGVAIFFSEALNQRILLGLSKEHIIAAPTHIANQNLPAYTLDEIAELKRKQITPDELKTIHVTRNAFDGHIKTTRPPVINSKGQSQKRTTV